MKNFMSSLTAALAVAVSLCAVAFTTAHAQSRTPPNHYTVCAVASTPTQTFNAVTYADLAGATCTFTTPRAVDTVNAAPIPTQTNKLRIAWSVDGSKATSTTGSCSIYVNGAVVAATERFQATAAGRTSIGGLYEVGASGNVPQTVKLQCRSGDTAVYTVTNGFLVVDFFAGS